VRVLKRAQRWSWKPDVLLVAGSAIDTADVVSAERGAIVVKDFSERPAWVRLLLARWLCARELRIHRALAELPEVPVAIGRIDALAVAFEHRRGRPLTRSLGSSIPAAFVGELEAAVAAMHDCGVVHLDLRHRANILLGDDGHPVLLDFGGAMCFRRGSWWYRKYRPTVLHFDHRALEKWRGRLAPGAEPSSRGWLRRLRARRRRRPS
jgi:hypothetical protein